MASKQTTEQVIGLIKSGMRSTDIATTLRISLPTVQGIKSQLTMKERTSEKLNSLAMGDINHSLDDSVVKAKSEAIINGYFLEKSISRPTPEELRTSLRDFSVLMAQLTSTSKLVRDSAKQAIRQFVNNHEEASSASLNKELTTESTSDQPETNRGKRWTQAEQDSLIEAWKDLSSKRDVTTVLKLSEKHDRTELAIIVRLFQASLITMAQGDELCVASQTPILISEKYTSPTKSFSKETKTTTPTPSSELSASSGDESVSARLCVECFQSIPSARLKASPYTHHCTKCLSKLEKRLDYHQYIDEGIAGTREEHKRMRGQDLSDIISRGRI